MAKFNFQVKTNKKLQSNEQLIKKFCRIFKKSGIIKDLKRKEYPVTKGMKKRQKKLAGRRRAKKNLAKKTNY